MGIAQAQQTVLDQFSSVAYNNNHGSQSWSSDWSEIADNNLAASGTIMITAGQLRVGSATVVTNTGVSIQRSANLSSTTNAILSFSISQTGVDSTGDGMVLEISSDGVSYTALQTFTNTAATLKTYNIAPYLSASTTVRFRISAALEAGEYFSLDDVQIALAFDYGDAPDTALLTGTANYQTTLSDSGPTHQIVTGLALGSSVDADNGVLQNAAADADDTTLSPDDEDGVVSFPNLPITATTYSVDVSVTNSTGFDAYLVGYIDRNRNGNFTGTGEKSATVVVPSSTTNPRTFTVTFSSLSSLSAGTSYMRFRLSATQLQAESSVGVATSGEVEDYRIGIGVDYGDAPDVLAGTATGDYQTRSADGGASHQILTGLMLGSSIDSDDGTLQNTTASADGADDDAVNVFPVLLSTDTTYSLNVDVNNSIGNNAYLVGYIDFNRDGDFSDAGERSSTVTVTSSSSNPRNLAVNFTGLSGGNVGSSFARFRLSQSQTQAESSVGLSNSGEVEDYPLQVSTTATLSGKVFRDEDVNDVFNLGDAGINLITITYYRDDGDGVFEPGSGDGSGTTVVSDSSGNYSFPAATTGAIWVAVDVTDDDLPTSYLPGGSTARFLNLTSAGSSANDFPFDPPGNGFPTCPAQAFLFQGAPTRAVIVDLVTGGFSYPPAGTMPYQVNAIAYNVLDNYIYGAIGTSADGSITRVDSSYRATRLGPIPGLPLAGIVVGDTDDNHHYYLYYSSRIYAVDLDPLSATYLTAGSVVTTSTAIADWAFNVIDKKLYAIDNNTGDLYRFAPSTGLRELIGYTGVPGSVASFGAAYNDPSGFLYFSNNTDGVIYRIDARDPSNVNPTAVFFSNGPASGSNDGARCLNAPLELDFGDAPDSYGTLIASNGPRHIIPTLGVNRLGASIDQESNGQATSNANGDDNNNLSDDDGVRLGGSSLQNQTFTAGTPYTLDITTTGSGVLNAWIDWNRDGDFLDATEQIATNVAPSSGAISLVLTLPPHVVSGVSYARFRYSTSAGLSPVGPASDGEVEDYKINLIANVDLELTKSVDITAPEPGDILIYTIAVTNTGLTDATGVSVVDTLPSNVLLIQTTGCAEDLLGVPTCTLGTIVTGATASYTIEAQVLASNALGTVITNTAEVRTADQLDTDSTPNNGATEDDLDRVEVTVSGLVLEKMLCNQSVTGACNYPADYSVAVTGKPGDIMEYRINYRRIGPDIFSVEMLDDVPQSTTLQQNVYDTALDKEVELMCPDGSLVYLEQGTVLTISINLANACVLSTAVNPLTSVSEEALLNLQSGYFKFRAKIQ
jgi:uncharacterized repeat protein (TIGR01451 family)